MTNPINPLDDLQQFSSASLPSAPKTHSSGRRELRQQLLSRGITLTVRPTSDADRAKMSRGEFVPSLPIKRAEPKRQGMTKKEWKRYLRSLPNPRKSCDLTEDSH